MSSKVVETETAATSIKKVRPHPNQNEGLIFEKSAAGKRGMEIPPLDVPAIDPSAALGPEFTRNSIEGFPEVSEIEVIRHFTRLSTWNYAIDLGMYPLGSCTMKYNPRVNEFVARLDGLASEHPQQPAEVSQGCCASFGICRIACWLSREWTPRRCSPRRERRASSPAF